MTETFITVKRRFFNTDIGLLYDMYAWFLLNEKYQLDINNSAVKDPEVFMVNITHCAAISYARETRKKIWFEREDVVRWLDNIKRGDLKRIQQTIEKSSDAVAKRYGKSKQSGEKKK